MILLLLYFCFLMKGEGGVHFYFLSFTFFVLSLFLSYLSSFIVFLLQFFFLTTHKNRLSEYTCIILFIIITCTSRCVLHLSGSFCHYVVCVSDCYVSLVIIAGCASVLFLIKAQDIQLIKMTHEQNCATDMNENLMCKFI